VTAHGAVVIGHGLGVSASRQTVGRVTQGLLVVLSALVVGCAPSRIVMVDPGSGDRLECPAPIGVRTFGMNPGQWGEYSAWRNEVERVRGVLQAH
jgi:hypothetical protein